MKAKPAVGIPLNDDDTKNQLNNNNYKLYDSEGIIIENQEKKKEEIIKNIIKFQVFFFDNIEEMKDYIIKKRLIKTK
jgi:hypothetical protein